MLHKPIAITPLLKANQNTESRLLYYLTCNWLILIYSLNVLNENKGRIKLVIYLLPAIYFWRLNIAYIYIDILIKLIINTLTHEQESG